MGNNIRSSSRPKALAPSIPMPPLADAMDAVHLSVDRFCLLAGVEALAEMMEEDATTVCGARHRRHGDRRGYRWGRTHSEIGYHGGKVKVARPRVRDRAGLGELAGATRTTARSVCPRATWRKRVATAPRSRPFPGGGAVTQAWLASALDRIQAACRRPRTPSARSGKRREGATNTVLEALLDNLLAVRASVYG